MASVLLRYAHSYLIHCCFLPLEDNVACNTMWHEMHLVFSLMYYVIGQQQGNKSAQQILQGWNCTVTFCAAFTKQVLSWGERTTSELNVNHIFCCGKAAVRTWTEALREKQTDKKLIHPFPDLYQNIMGSSFALWSSSLTVIHPLVLCNPANWPANHR